MFKSLKVQLASLVALVSTFAGNAYAAVPAEVTTSLTDGKADAIVVAGSVLAIMIAVSAFLWMRRAAK